MKHTLTLITNMKHTLTLITNMKHTLTVACINTKN